MKAWQMEKELMEQAVPRILQEEEQTWDAIEPIENMEDMRTKLWWYSEVPGSGAPERLVIAAIQAMENRGYKVEEAEEWIEAGLEAYDSDLATLHLITARIFRILFEAPKDRQSTYWQYEQFTSWSQVKDNTDFIEPVYVDTQAPDYPDKIYAGWMAQIIGGAIGTAMEGYTTAQLKKKFGSVTDYIRKPNTFNDDITFELAFLKALEVKGDELTAVDIAEQWVALIPFGWSAEDIALRNLKLGLFPPESGTHQNPFSDWIGAQMRGAVCGMAAPGNPEKAARLAWMDGSISHAGNGILGEVFNAVLTSLAFVEPDIRTLLEQAVDMIPTSSEYYSVIEHAMTQCKKTDNWEEAWHVCEARYEKYNWIHAYPNAAAEVVALWFGNGDFNRTMEIVALAGQDVDCNAAQIATVLGIAKGIDAIDQKWRAPIGDELVTYVRGMKQMTISGLADWTVKVVRNSGRR
jgi:ADP-ribosylglycohydrolase